ncbi:sensor histidine kinase [Salipaludibacillus daqingensis]|uniref:sensor histidine kinase n=1 Tax=Salipaludibacillus daqingensis TaxID=3041001 RepID=UPI0024753794|nr:HAMP domain-containing sensor histidine kinase [Salipaludibacillus daqingensis]
MFKNKGMFIKLFSSHLLILLFSFLVFALLLNSLIHNEMTTRYNKTFDHQGERLVEHFREARQQGWDEETLLTSLEMSMNQENRQILLFDGNGDALYHHGFLEDLGVSQSVVHDALQGETMNRRVRTDGFEIVYMMAAPLTIPDADSPEHAMVMFFHEFDRESSQIVWINFITSLVTVSLTAIIIFFVSRRMTAPLRKMRNSAMQYAKGDFSHRIHVDSKDEIGQLANTFNHMAKELGSLDQLRKDFVANVSHDLRSPLTSIRGFLGAMMDGTIPAEKQKHYLTIMRNETDRLMKLVNDLLDTASIEAGNWNLEKKQYNVAEQLRMIIAKMEPSASEHQIDMELTSEDEIIIFADEERMEQVWINLLQNAVQNSDPNSSIQLKIIEKEIDVEVLISDKGKGMTKEELSHIWDRFYKTDKARSKRSGTGIGLSIVKQIIDLHDATINVDSEINEGTDIKIVLPKQ